MGSVILKMNNESAIVVVVTENTYGKAKGAVEGNDIKWIWKDRFMGLKIRDWSCVET